MSIERVYNHPLGRAGVVVLQRIGGLRLAGWYLKTRMSKRMIPGYIKKNQIDMRDFEGQKYDSFSAFFARKRETVSYNQNPNVLISPCDGLLSVYRITDDMNLALKGSHYRLKDLIPNEEVAEELIDGICLVFRLRASDYHHFCAFDDAFVQKNHYIPGKLHSVQPIACEKVPVYRLNRRWWNVMDTVHFGTVVQMEIGAMLVGGLSFIPQNGWIGRGEEMGNFELAGSTLLLLLSADIRKRLEFIYAFRDAESGAVEIPVHMGEGVGVLCDENEKNTGAYGNADSSADWCGSV